jgi:hypothetical protein
MSVCCYFPWGNPGTYSLCVWVNLDVRSDMREPLAFSLSPNPSPTYSFEFPRATDTSPIIGTSCPRLSAQAHLHHRDLMAPTARVKTISTTETSWLRLLEPRPSPPPRLHGSDCSSQDHLHHRDLMAPTARAKTISTSETSWLRLLEPRPSPPPRPHGSNCSSGHLSLL